MGLVWCRALAASIVDRPGPLSIRLYDFETVRVVAMSRVCQVTGKKPSFGKNVSHSHRKTNRRWDVNIQKKRYYIASEKKWVTLTLSAKLSLIHI